MLVSLVLLIGQLILAYLVLELVFSRIDLSPEGLVPRLRRTGRLYAVAAAAASAGAGWLQFYLVGLAGLAVAVGNWIPWWLLWRFGLRKQLTFLFKDDGGRPAGLTKPDQ